MSETLTLHQRLELKCEVAVELYREGRITRGECFRHEVDVTVEKDSGPIKLAPVAPT